MNKEQILSMSRNENNDEGFRNAENKGREIAIAVFSAVFIFILIMNFLNGKDSHAPKAMFWAFIATEAYPKYQFSKNKAYLVITIAGAITCLAALANFVLEVQM